MATRVHIKASAGPQILKVLDAYADKPIMAMIVIAFPDGPDPQPEFITNIEPEHMENVIISLAAQMTPEVRASRQMNSVHDERTN